MHDDHLYSLKLTYRFEFVMVIPTLTIEHTPRLQHRAWGPAADARPDIAHKP